MRSILKFTLNGLTILGITLVVFASTIWPSTPIAADTTGEFPNTDVVNSQLFLEDKQIDLELYSQDDIDCLATNMYFEARSDGYAGMYATSLVVMNRVVDNRYPNTVCEVVKQGPVRESWKTRDNPTIATKDRVFFPVKNKCQFSWYCDGKADNMYDEASLNTAKEIAKIVLSDFAKNGAVDITEGSTHYHTVAINPYWANSRGMMKITQVGTHVFYKWN